MQFLRERRAALGGRCRRAGAAAEPLAGPGARAVQGASSRAPASARSRPRWRSCACSRRCCATSRSAARIVPIVPDESRTFGMEGMFRQVGIYSPLGQLYQPQDSEQLMFYKEDKHGQILEEGITEAGSISSFIAAGTSYSAHGDADDPVLHLLLDVRLPAGRRSRSGRPATAARAASCSAARRGARRSTARGSSTRTATATCCSRSFPTAARTTRRSPTRSR